MKRKQFSKILRDASVVSEVDQFIVIGSQALLGTYSDVVLGDRLKFSVEVDLIVLGDVEAVDKLEAWGGLQSQYNETYGVYVDLVSFATVSTAPDGWQERLIPYEPPDSEVTAFCMHPADLFVTKLLAGRDKDLEFVEEQAALGFVSVNDICFDGLSREQKRKVKQAVKRYGVRDVRSPSPAVKTKLDAGMLEVALKREANEVKREAVYEKLFRRGLKGELFCKGITRNGLPCQNRRGSCPHH